MELYGEERASVRRQRNRIRRCWQWQTLTGWRPHSGCFGCRDLLACLSLEEITVGHIDHRGRLISPREDSVLYPPDPHPWWHNGLQ